MDTLEMLHQSYRPRDRRGAASCAEGRGLGGKVLHELWQLGRSGPTVPHVDAVTSRAGESRGELGDRWRHC